jgi:uncharacterized repeat protein (TIGR03803 family)
MRKLCSFGLFVLALLALFGVAPAQTYTKLWDLGTQTGDPLNPAWLGTFAQGRDGNLYSTTQGGGDNALGAVFQLTPSGTMTKLFSFDNTKGAQPYGGLTLGTDGSLYGTTYVGGSTGFGTIFKITTGGTLKSLHSFNGNTEGELPTAPPVQGVDGNFYGSTGNGGTNFGVIYRMTSSGNLKVLYTFDGVAPHGRYPRALVLGIDGNFYGTSRGGGTNNDGTIFKMTPSGKLTTLHSFTGPDGQFPDSSIIQGNDGNFYGTSRGGGTDGLGVIYKMTPAGVLTVIHNFLETDGLGYSPFSGLVQATDGKFYGTAIGPSHGLLYQITSTGTYTVVHFFAGADGQSPQVAMIQHTGGTLYGDTDAGGVGNIGCVTCGVLYSLNMGLGPFVGIVNWSGTVGTTIELLGQGFTGTTKVSFNGVRATTFTVVSDTYLTAVVPAGATTGFISVTTPGGNLKSNRKFLVVPSILSFDPTSGPVGTPVTITGTSFTGAKKVAFNGVAATFTVNSDTQISTTVPTGAQTGKIQVTTPGGNATSATDFTVTP